MKVAWWISSPERDLVKKKYIRPDDAEAKFKVYICKNCDQIFESCYEQSIARSNIYYYEEFPRYKLERKVCKLCEG